MKTGECVIIETRILDNFRDIVLNHVHFSGFSPVVVHGCDNGEYVKEELKDIPCRFINIGLKELSAAGYNRLLTSKFLWESLEAEHILVFQHDSRLLRHGIEEFFKYDYIGSLIYHFPDCWNGGLSLRRRKKMLEAVTNVPYHPSMGQEDIYFSRVLKSLNAVLPDKETAAKFSVETVASIGSWGVHNIQRYLCPEIVSHLLNQYQ